MTTWRFVPISAVLAMHSRLMIEHGGAQGALRRDLLESALARPRQALACGHPPPDLFALAAAYGYGLARNHCFTDGNRRVALAVTAVFLRLNGQRLAAPEPDAVVTFRALAAGDLDEERFAGWLRDSCSPLTAAAEAADSSAGYERI